MINPAGPVITTDKILSAVQSDFVNSILNSTELSKIKYEINQPSGDFFYDPWTIKSEFKNSVFEDILSSLDSDIGEARIIVLKPGSCYHSHADIDDRYHLNLQGQYSYLIDLDSNQMFPTNVDGIWYNMNAGARHVASNFGSIDRIQLVVRKLLTKNQLTDFSNINLKILPDLKHPRFVFDDVISPWLNRASKEKIISNFKTDFKQAWFDIENSSLEDLKKILPAGIELTITSNRY